MIKLDITSSLLNIDFLEKSYKDKLESALSEIQNKRKSLWFIDLDINNEIEKINSFAKSNNWEYEEVVVIWIWWSALWTRAILTAIKWKYYNEFSKEKRNNNPKLYILDNVDPKEFEDIENLISLDKTLFIVISKSGCTLETRAAYKYFSEKIDNIWLDIKNHFVVIAWENSDFKEKSINSWLKVFDIPENVGGRFSVFTAVWLLPLALVWVDIKGLIEWIKSEKENFLSLDLYKNPSLLYSIIQYHNYIELWKNITVFFPYAANMIFFWHWLKQLIWESLWKNSLGITLVDAIWVTDQHSQLQLYYDGPDDKTIVFLDIEDFENEKKVSINHDIKFSDLMKLEKYGTCKSITDYNKSNLSIKIDKLDEKSLWELIYFFEMSTAFLWEFMQINAFDQPWVEIWKNITKKEIESRFNQLNF